MSTVSRLRFSLLALAAMPAVTACGGEEEQPVAIPDDVRLGGDATVFVDDRNSYTHPAPNLGRESERTFYKGRALFRDQWVVAPASTDSRDGLGPLFNARNCEGCHPRDGRGRPPEEGEPMTQMFVRLSIPGQDEHGGALPEPTYGDQFQPLASPGVDNEGSVTIVWETESGQYDDGEGYELRRPRYVFDELTYGPMHEDVRVTGRIPRRLIGLGLLAAIPEEDILGGVGTPNIGYDTVTGEHQLGRFGWKATQPNVKQQAALAFLHDLGLSTSLYPEQPCTSVQSDCNAATPGAPDGEPEIYDVFLDNVTLYVAALAVPARRDWHDPQVQAGQRLFEDVGCTSCHTPMQRTGSVAVDPAFENQTIYPYTDLLLHDMGEELADGRDDYEASGSQWRTPPLWGIGLVEVVNEGAYLMHDGRARTFAEAILWHGGEAAVVRDQFKRLPKADRRALVRFLESL